jgi:hypothetical protein
MQYPAIWHSILLFLSLTKFPGARGNLLPDRRQFQQVNYVDAVRAMQIF